MSQPGYQPSKGLGWVSRQQEAHLDMRFMAHRATSAGRHSLASHAASSMPLGKMLVRYASTDVCSRPREVSGPRTPAAHQTAHSVLT